MKLTLLIDGKEKTFTQDFISGRMFRRTLEISKKFQDGQIDVETLDIAVDYVVDLFGGQFSRDEFYDGIEAGRLIPTIVDCVNEVVNKATAAIGVDGAPKIKQGA